MKNQKKKIWSYCTVFLVGAFLAGSKVSAQANYIKQQVYNCAIPVLKRLENNPVQRLKIIIPDSMVHLETLSIYLDRNAYSSLSEIHIYTTGDHPYFSDKLLIGSESKLRLGNNSVKLSAKLNIGTNYIWVSIKAKESALVGQKIHLSIAAIIFSNKKIVSKRQVDLSKNNWTIGTSLRKPGDDSVHTFRIPGIIKTNRNTLIAVYDVRYNNSADLPGHVDLGMSRSTNGGQTWEPMKIILSMGRKEDNSGVGDPCILFDPLTKKIWVAALWSKGNHSIVGSLPGLSPDSSGQFVLVNSNDDGKSWSRPTNITSQVKNPIWHLYFQGPGNGIALADGTLVFPSQYWDETQRPGIPHSSIIYSRDHGMTWKTGTAAKSNTTESQVVETTPGVIMLNMRDNRGKYRSIATSIDYGKTWTEHPCSYKLLQDPVCMASLIKVKAKVQGHFQDILLYSGMNSQINRDSLTIKASFDNSQSWPVTSQLLVDERNLFGYSSLVQIDEDTVGILYEGIRNLNFVKIAISDILKLKK